MERTYPYEAWALQPQFKPVPITLAKTYESYSSIDYGDVTEGGKLYQRGDIFPTKEAAIAAGWERIAAMEAKIAKTQAGIDKKKASLTKAAK